MDKMALYCFRCHVKCVVGSFWGHGIDEVKKEIMLMDKRDGGNHEEG